MKCKNCKTLKKADNCQICFITIKTEIKKELTGLLEKTKIIHISTIEKIENEIKDILSYLSEEA